MKRPWYRVLTIHDPLKKRMGNHFSILALRTMISMKRQKDMTLKDKLARWVGAQYATGEEWRYSFRKNEETEFGVK